MQTIGIDVSKAKLDVLWLKDIKSQKVKTKVVDNTLDGFDALVQWALTNTGVGVTQIQFVMEATGIYHEPLAHALYDVGARVVVVNPAKIRTHAQSLGVHNKTDNKDSFVIAHYAMSMDTRPWQPETPEIRELKALIARYHCVEKDLRRELNRLEKARFTHTSAAVDDSIVTMVTMLKQQKRALQDEMDRHIDQHPTLKQDRALLHTIPGVGTVISTLMLSLLHSRAFICASQCSAFIGLNPIQYESGSSVYKRSRLSKKGDATIRAKLYMAAVVATRCNPDIKNQYQRLLKHGKSKMAALGAAMRKLVQICFGVVKHQCKYQPQVNSIGLVVG